MSKIPQQIEKIFNEYKFLFLINMDYINIQIQNNNTHNIYESKFTLEYLQQFKLLMGNLIIEEMIDCIISFIEQKDIIIKENEKNLKLILISRIKTYPNTELILNKNNNIVEILNKEIQTIKDENKVLKGNIEDMKIKLLIENENKKEIKKINKNIELIQKYDFEKLNNKIKLMEKENEDLKNTIKLIANNNENIDKKIKKEKEELYSVIEMIIKNITDLNNKIELIQKNNEEINNEIENEKKMLIKIKKQNRILKEYINKDKYEMKLIKSISQNNIIQQQKNYIKSLSVFPLGNIISACYKSIIIYDNNLNILQTIPYAHNGDVNYIEILNENNFISCSSDKSIKFWIKKDYQFINNKTINNAHENNIIKVLYCSNKNLISCSYDNTIKIWKENNNNYENIKILTHSDSVRTILFLEDKNILISSGLDGTKFWNLNKNETNYNNIKCIKYIKEAECYWNKGLYIDEDKIIIGGDEILIVISILNKTIIKKINIPFQCWGIQLIEDKGLFLIGGWKKDIMIYRNDNYECIQTIKNAHDDNINGFVELNDETIISYSFDNKIKIWKF